jgi:hypothetical protein
MNTSPRVVSDKMLIAAMKKAVELSIFSKFAEEDEYLKNWARMKQVLDAAISEN